MNGSLHQPAAAVDVVEYYQTAAVDPAQNLAVNSFVSISVEAFRIHA